MALVKFIQGTAAQYAALTAKDADTLYFISDERRIYKGDTPYSGGIYQAVTAYPATGVVNTLYVNTTDGSVQYWNGAAYQQVVKPSATAISGAGDDNHFATTKAIVDYVTEAVADLDISAVTDRISALETKMATVQGTGEGSITKAAADAQTAAIAAAKTETTNQVTALKDGEVKDNADAIAALQTTVAGKADKATTLAGYGITDAYTKAQADSAIATAVANADHLKREIVATLPAVADADENTIYMVGSGDGSADSVYLEYMLIGGGLEKIGDSTVDLTAYAKTADVNASIATAKSEAISTAAADAKTKADAAQAAAATDATTKADAALASAKAYTDAEIEKIEIPDVSSFITAADIKTGTANGTISVEGTDVAVKGLGSAAYTASTAYDAAGAADKALTDAKAYADGLASNYATATQGTRADQAYNALTWGTL